MKHMDAFPILYTANLQLRKIQIEDVPALVQYANNKKISDHIVNIPHPYREPDAVFRIRYVVEGFKRKARYCFTIVLKERAELIGEASLHLENDGASAQLGYWIGEPFWNKGFATEAVGALLAFGFEQVNLQKVLASTYENNLASEKVMLKNGMKQIGVSRSMLHFELTKDVYENQRILK